MRIAAALTAALLLGLTAGPAPAAQPDPQEARCGGVTGNPKLAVEVCTRLIEFGNLEPLQLAQAYFNRGTEWASQGQHDRAVGDFNLAVELDPKLVSAYYNRALSHSNLGQSVRAIADYNRVLQLAPKDMNALIGRAVESTMAGDHPRALADYEEVIRREPNGATGYFGRGRARFYADEFFIATSDFLRAHRLDPSVYTALWIFLARKRADIPGELTLAHEAGTSGAGEWPAAIVGLYLGKGTPQAVEQAAAHSDPARQREQQCEAYFYTAQWHLLRAAREPALKLLREAQKTCPRTFIEHEGALAELRRLKQKP